MGNATKPWFTVGNCIYTMFTSWCFIDLHDPLLIKVFWQDVVVDDDDDDDDDEEEEDDDDDDDSDNDGDDDG